MILRIRFEGAMLAAISSGAIYGDQAPSCTPVCCDWPPDVGDSGVDVDDWGFEFKAGPSRLKYVLVSGGRVVSSTPEVVVAEMLACVAGKALPDSASPKHGLRWHGGALCVSTKTSLDAFCADVSLLYPEIGSAQLAHDMATRIAAASKAPIAEPTNTIRTRRRKVGV